MPINKKLKYSFIYSIHIFNGSQQKIEFVLSYTKDNTNCKMEQIIEKLNQMEEPQDYNTDLWNDWSLKEKKQLLDMYLIISKKEDKIYDLIYSLHGCDSWEDIFRDYSGRKMDDKTDGVVIAVDEITKQIANENEKETQ